MAIETATIMVAMTMVLIAKNADGDESSVGDPHGDGDDVTALLVMVITILRDSDGNGHTEAGADAGVEKGKVILADGAFQPPARCYRGELELPPVSLGA